MPEQESYSYLYGYLYLAADDDAALTRRAAMVEDELAIRFAAVD